MIIGMYQGQYHARQLLALLRSIPAGSTGLRIQFHDTGQTTLDGVTAAGPATWHTTPIFGRGQLSVELTERDLDELHEQICRIHGSTVWLHALPHLLQARAHCTAV